jgi:hypothetical protein
MGGAYAEDLTNKDVYNLHNLIKWWKEEGDSHWYLRTVDDFIRSKNSTNTSIIEGSETVAT